MARPRLHVVSAPSGDDKHFKEQQNELAVTADEFASCDMALVTLLDNAVSSAGDRQLTTSEASAARASLGIQPGASALKLIGKDGSIKLSGASVTPMTEIYALIDTMPMRPQEMHSR